MCRAREWWRKAAAALLVTESAVCYVATACGFFRDVLVRELLPPRRWRFRHPYPDYITKSAGIAQRRLHVNTQSVKRESSSGGGGGGGTPFIIP